MNDDEYVNERLLQHAAEHELMRRREALQEARKIVEMDGLGPIGPADEFTRDMIRRIRSGEVHIVDGIEPGSPVLEQMRAANRQAERMLVLWVAAVCGWAAFLAVIVVSAMR